MKLATRVSAFFLVTFAAGLLVYSLVFYSLARKHIEHQFEQELQGALNSLVAAVEVEETEVKWQPLEHEISLGTNDENSEIYWAVIGDRSLFVEKSPNADAAFAANAMALARNTQSNGKTIEQVDGRDQRHHLYQRLVAPRPDPAGRELDEFDEVLIVVGRSAVQRDRTLSRLLMMVITLPLIAWLLVGGLGQWLMRHALRPVRLMSQQAQAITGTDFQTRLQVADSGDELSDLATVFNRLLDRQQVAFNQQRRFAGDAAHELRTPLTVLLGQIDVTLLRPRSADEYVSKMQLLRQQTVELQEIVESLLFLARAEEDSLLPQMEELAVADWLSRSWPQWSQVPRAGDLTLQNELDPEVEVRANSLFLTRILQNLISNALKYSPPGSPVGVRGWNTADKVLFQVTDAGVGIAPEDQTAIFEPFFRSPNARKAGVAGTGLGLAIAQRISRSLGGQLTCESELGRGSCFTLSLPRAAESMGPLNHFAR